ncbi:hypothetical protein FVF58_01965 [Paraburkholderia panacisoli]|uniref:Uncharacterized protein n=1 Tax=Paraburkholderia panacisoli TaxID=2603818 RepID=A0A5B0HLI1_9BURK|nr:hypothetical protein FVF58_01965 [Paraburkholderia panacisoli]
MRRSSVGRNRCSSTGFFSPIVWPPQIPRCEKFFCVVKNRVAEHKIVHCNRGKVVSQCETCSVSH